MAAVNAANLHSTFGLSPEAAKSLARLLREARTHEEIDKAMEAANAALNGHGVEAIQGDYHVDRYYFDIVATYVNMGDTYNATILLVTESERFQIVSFGDWVERNERKYRIR